MAAPVCSAGSPLPPMVAIPSTKSVGFEGIGIGRHRIWLGVGGASLNGPVRINPVPIWRNGLWTVDGRIRYVQVARLTARGAVNDVPFNSSTYRPRGACWGAFCVRGSAPATASDANSWPKPAWYWGALAMGM